MCVCVCNLDGKLVTNVLLLVSKSVVIFFLPFRKQMLGSSVL